MSDLESEIVLRLKSADRYVTREELGASSGTDTARLAGALDALRARGYRIDEVPGEGLRLVWSPDLLSATEVKAALRDPGRASDSPTAFASRVHCSATLDSTNDLAAALAREGAGEGTLVVADRQARGRGRLGREWESRPGLGLWFSLVLRPDIQASRSCLISLVAALGVASRLRDDYRVNAVVKWPNDVVVGRGKICGILTESELVGDRVRFVILGVGLNVLHTRGDFSPDLRGRATSIRIETGQPERRVEALASVVRGIEGKYRAFLAEGFGDLRRELLLLSPLVGRQARISTGRGDVEGTVVDIDDDGALVLRGEGGGRTRVLAGDVTQTD
jgi:BirA family biotin operon repressor/biotin-[acetyl-CoA-carboxylase] ligase